MVDLGLPPNLSSIALLYNGPSRCLIAFASTDGGRVGELYCRYSHTPKYTKISVSSDDVSIAEPVSCANSPVVIFNVWTIRPGIEGGYDWASLSAYDLVSHEMRDIVSLSTLPVMARYERGWIAGLISVDGEARTAIVTAGFMRPVKGGGVVDYALYELDCVGRKLSKITDLPGIFA